MKKSVKQKINMQEKIATLVVEIKADFKKLGDLKDSQTEIKLRIARKVDALFLAVRAEKMNWNDFVKKNFKYQSLRSISRHRKIVKNLDLDQYPSVVTAGLGRLEKIAKVVGDGKLGDVLKKHKIDHDCDIDNPNEVKKYKGSIDQMLKEEKVRPKPVKPKTMVDFDRLCKRLQNINDQLQRLSDTDREKIRKYMASKMRIETLLDARDIYDVIEGLYGLYLQDPGKALEDYIVLNPDLENSPKLK